jgi:sterol desaturase/sphingolipid hydroxylase (fatty acid hydroxylase superfamily)
MELVGASGIAPTHPGACAVVELILYSIPAFVLLMAVELIAYRLGDHNEDLVGYEAHDTRTSLTLGAGNVLINVFWKFGMLVVYTVFYELTPLRMPADKWWTYAALFLADDFAYYWFHRVHHVVRFFWASHVVHHSSQHYNLSTALRQSWTPMTALPFWIPLALVGFAPWMILLQKAINLIYQFWLHTERIGKLPAPIELIFNTPSHHRVHHGANDVYLDRNYAGILIIWDRLFGSFQAEDETPCYGLTRNIDTFNVRRVAFDEFAALARDIRGAGNWRDRVRYTLGRPGWSPDGRDHGTRG